MHTMISDRTPGTVQHEQGRALFGINTKELQTETVTLYDIGTPVMRQLFQTETCLVFITSDKDSIHVTKDTIWEAGNSGCQTPGFEKEVCVAEMIVEKCDGV